ncbi:hypothetical protein HMPREF0204_14338 [Chryseobacterium gleum ATCC 35910]|uniref:Uncharacterized protein n=1 Tax=Chryseobacterium gleum ATCC 35910 TaxID=525257 RepID=A0ABN0AQB7_CHRGE|nr:hypothetical protein HMPREF0204_14338 [Chryseobacterium gleum ATCC 35910]
MQFRLSSIGFNMFSNMELKYITNKRNKNKTWLSKNKTFRLRLKVYSNV